jgi:hypothetical protein
LTPARSLRSVAAVPLARLHIKEVPATVGFIIDWDDCAWRGVSPDCIGLFGGFTGHESRRR